MLTFSVNPDLYEGYKKINLSNMPTTEKGKEWLGEMWLKAHTLDDVVNTDGYGFKCAENTKKKDSKKYSAMLSVEEIAEGKKGVSDTVAMHFDDNIDDIINRSEVVTVSEEFLDMREYLIAEIEVDILFVMEKALQRNARAMAKLKEVTDEFGMFDMVRKVIQPEFMQYIRGVVA